MAKRRYYRDAATGRYRDAKGHFTKPPTSRGVFADALGRPIDSRGRLIPRSDVRQVKRAAAPERQYFIRVAKRRYYRDAKTGRYRDAKGHFTKPPTSRSVFKDAAGRPIDSRGRLIPRSDVRQVKRAAAPERQYFWSPKEQKFRDGSGHYRKPPKGRQIKKDERGRPIDYAGHLVPIEKVAPKPKPPKARQKTFDGERWRYKGRFTKAPTAAQVRRDKDEYPIDAHGRRVPLNVVKEEKIPPRAALTEVRRIGIGETSWRTPEHLRLDEREQHFRNFSKMNRQDLTDISGESKAREVFEAALEGHLGASGFERDELTLYDFGLLLRPQDRTIPEALLTDVRERLAGTGAQVTVVQEGPGQESLLLQLGDDKLPVSANNVESQVEGASEIMSTIYNEFLEWFDDEPMWAMWWDTDEEMY